MNKNTFLKAISKLNNLDEIGENSEVVVAIKGDVAPTKFTAKYTTISFDADAKAAFISDRYGEQWVSIEDITSIKIAYGIWRR